MANRSLSRRDFVKSAGFGAALGISGCGGISHGPDSCESDRSKLSKADRTPQAGNLPDYYRYRFKSLKIGLCQVHTKQWAIEDNLERTIAAIESAAEQGAEIAVTPECVLHAYAWDDSEGKSQQFRQRLYGVAEPLDGEHLQLVCGKARELGIYILIGFVERGDNNRIHNSAALISRQGKIVNLYRKVHCRPFEDIHYRGYFTPGDEFTVKELRFGDRQFKVGTMICFDREIPESVRCLRSLGAEIILCPLACDTSDMAGRKNRVNNEIITRCRAASNEVYIAVVNHAARFNGGSFVVGPTGELLKQLRADAEVYVLDVPVGVIAKKFHSNPIGWMGWSHRRQDVYDKYLS